MSQPDIPTPMESPALQEKIKQIRTDTKRQDRVAIKLSKKLLEGRGYSESIEVEGVAGDLISIDVYALPEEKIKNILKQFRIKSVKKIEEMNTDEQLELFQEIAAMAISTKEEAWLPTDIGSILKVGGSASIAMKCFQLSGLLGGKEEEKFEDLENFRPPQTSG